MNLLPAVAEPHSGHGGLLGLLDHVVVANISRRWDIYTALRKEVLGPYVRDNRDYHNNTYAAACSQHISSISSAKRTAVASFARVVNNAATSTRQSGRVDASE